MNTKRRKSSHREKIYSCIRKSDTHPTAIDIYTYLRGKDINISLSNIYRNLEILIEEGRITRRDFGDKADHYDAVADPHHHFICNECGSARDFSLPFTEDILKSAMENIKDSITGFTIYFYGICNKCKKGGK